MESGRTTPLHVVAPVRHPRTIELINYITSHSHKAAGNSRKDFGAVKALTANQRGTKGREGRQGVVMDVDVLLPDELLSGLLTQVSVQPELLSVMNDLFDAQGMFWLRTTITGLC